MVKLEIFQPMTDLAIWLRFFIGHIIIIEGLISAGKTTLGKSLEKLFKDYSIKCIFFIEYKNAQLLSIYVNDMANEAYGYQIMMLRERIHVYELAEQKAKEGYVVLIDRSKAGDLAFALMQYNKGFFDEPRWQAYQHVLQTPTTLTPSIIAYLNVSPEKAYQQMLERNEDCEVKGYTYQYFIDLHDAYQRANEMINTNMTYITWGEKYDLQDGYLPEKISVNFLQQVFDIICHNMYQSNLILDGI